MLAGAAGLALSAGAARAQSYTVTELDLLERTGFAFGINDSGAAAASVVQDWHFRGAYEAGGGPQEIAPLPGDAECWALGVSQAGAVVAVSFTLGDLAPKGVLWQSGVSSSLGTFAPRAISASGLIAGSITISDAALGQVDHAARWIGGNVTDLGTLGGSHSYALGINGYGQAVGYAFAAGDAGPRAALWQGGAAQDLGTLGGAVAQAQAISDGRGVVGVSTTASGAWHGFLFTVDSSGAVLSRWDLGTLGGATHSCAYGVNAALDVVGTSGSRAFLWRAGQMRDLNTLIPAGSEWVLERAWAISGTGRIVGTGQHRGAPKPFLLTPAPPACYANCDGSTTAPVLNVLDFNCFLNRFSAGEAYANCDGSTVPPVLNVLDFNCFLNRFVQGCP
jgi:probable HAF family extracellular repeat protein